MTFEEALTKDRYDQAVKILIGSEDRSTRGYTMARSALAWSTQSNCWGVKIEDAMEELLDADKSGELVPPLSDKLRKNMGSFLETGNNLNWSLEKGLASILLAQVLTHELRWLHAETSPIILT